jgi:hypothetical protein
MSARLGAGDVRVLAVALAIALAFAARALAGNVSLGDLRVPASRLSDWFAPNETAYQAARSWPEYDVTCAAAPCPSGKHSVRELTGVGSCPLVTTADADSLDCFVDSAAESNIVLWIPNGSYAIGGGLSVGRSNIVVRGQSRTGTILRKTSGSRVFVGGACDANSGGNLVSVCGASYRGSPVGWTAGYTPGVATVTVADTSRFSTGGYALLRMDGSTACSLMDRTLNSGASADGFVHIAKVVAKTATTLTLDRALRMNYAAPGCSGRTAEPYTPVTNVGVERLRLTSDPSVPVCANQGCMFFPHVNFTGAADSWLVDTVVDRVYDTWIFIAYSRGVWLQGNDFSNLDMSVTFGTNAIYLREGANDTVIENNSCRGSKSCNKHDNGAEGNVTAYNYLHLDDRNCDRAVSLHGHYVRAELIEGNDVNCEMQMADTFWGRNGPFITVYRNRNTSPVCNGAYGSSDTIGINDDGWDGTFPAADGPLNMIGNTAGQFHVTPTQNNPVCPPSIHNKNAMSDLVTSPASGVPGIWLEQNAFRTPGGSFAAGSSNARSCGTGPDDACPGTNGNISKPDASWNGAYPVSLYRASAPSWWCQEACPWTAAGIGAFGDDFGGPLCKLPAEIRVSGGVCTPLSGGSPPAPNPPPPSTTPPVAPTLL